MIEINTIESPFTFVKGEVTTGTPADDKVACGPGTSHPAIATLHQLSEMFCRVRNTIITDYEFKEEHENFPSLFPKYHTLFKGGNPPGKNIRPYIYADTGWSSYGSRGMSCYSELNPKWLAAHCSGAYSAYGSGDYNADAEDELCFWPAPNVSCSAHGMSHSAGNAINTINDVLNAPSTYGPYRQRTRPPAFSGDAERVDYSGAFIAFSFSPTIAFVDGNSPFDKGVKLYPQMSFVDSFSNSSNGFGQAASAGNAEIVLASGTLLIPFYLQASNGYKATLVSAPRLEVTDWWPYGKGLPISAVWDATTGAAVNGGPGA